VRQWRKGEDGKKKMRRPRLKLFLNRDPQAEPTLLVRSLLGRVLGVGALPPTVGCMIVDPVICWALGRHLRTGQGFGERPVQLFVQGCASPRLVMGRVGETVAELCRRHGVKEDLGTLQVIVNGMMAGREVAAGTERVGWDTEAVTVRQRVAAEEAAPCVSCGWCIDVCPTGLTPVRLMELAQANGASVQSKAAQEARHCIACGLCSYVCPTRLPLMEKTVELKGKIRSAEGRIQK
jgi:electron transport complex protein RnfC